jgi:hypothetical protein
MASREKKKWDRQHDRELKAVCIKHPCEDNALGELLFLDPQPDGV